MNMVVEQVALAHVVELRALLFMAQVPVVEDLLFTVPVGKLFQVVAKEVKLGLALLVMVAAAPIAEVKALPVLFVLALVVAAVQVLQMAETAVYMAVAGVVAIARIAGQAKPLGKVAAALKVLLEFFLGRRNNEKICTN
jgi:hypothetical protein